MSRKQEIYLEMMRDCLPWIRNTQTMPFWVKAIDKSCLLEAQLIHNLPLFLSEAEPDFDIHDIHFLNGQANWYILNCNSRISPLYDRNCELIAELRELVPDNLKKKLN